MLCKNNKPIIQNMPPQFHHYMISMSVWMLILFISIRHSYSIPAPESKFDDAAPQSIYEALKSHGLPIGLLPKGVSNFSFDDETGRFQVYLDQACNAKFESQLHYDRNVSGTLSYGQIAALSGISAQELFLWFPVKGIHVDVPSSGLIYFDVGVVFKQLSLSLFETPPDCMAVSPVSPPDLGDGTLITEVVSKSQVGKLRYGLDQKVVLRAVL